MQNEQDLKELQKEKLQNFISENEEKVKNYLLLFYSCLLGNLNKITNTEILIDKLIKNFRDDLDVTVSSDEEKQTLSNILKTSLRNSVTKFSDEDFQEKLKIFLQGYAELAKLSLTEALKTYMHIIKNELQSKNKQLNTNLLAILSNPTAFANNQADNDLTEKITSSTTKKPKGIVPRSLRDNAVWNSFSSWSKKEDQVKASKLKQFKQVDTIKAKTIKQVGSELRNGAIFGILIAAIWIPAFMYQSVGPTEKQPSEEEIYRLRKLFFLSAIAIVLTITGGFYGTTHALDRWRKYKRDRQEDNNNAQKILNMQSMLKKLIQIEILSAEEKELATEDSRAESKTEEDSEISSKTNTNIYFHLTFLSLEQIKGEALPHKKIKGQKPPEKPKTPFWQAKPPIAKLDHEWFDGLIDTKTINIPTLRGIPNNHILVAETAVRKQAKNTTLTDKALDVLIALGTTDPHTAAKDGNVGLVDISPAIPGNLFMDGVEITGEYSKKLKNSLHTTHEIFCLQSKSKKTKGTLFFACHLADYHDRPYPKFITGPKIFSADFKKTVIPEQKSETKTSLQKVRP